MSDQQITAQRMIDAPIEKIFDIVSDPARHPEIDGSGMVKDAPEGARPTKVGDHFGMSMKWGAPYKMTNEVVVYEPNHKFVWSPSLATGPRFMAKVIGGHRWGYTLETLGDNETLVTEAYDWSRAPAPTRAYIHGAGWPKRAEKAMIATLERLDAVATGRAAKGPPVDSDPSEG